MAEKEVGGVVCLWMGTRSRGMIPLLGVFCAAAGGAFGAGIIILLGADRLPAETKAYSYERTIPVLIGSCVWFPQRNCFSWLCLGVGRKRVGLVHGTAVRSLKDDDGGGCSGFCVCRHHSTLTFDTPYLLGRCSDLLSMDIHMPWCLEATEQLSTDELSLAVLIDTNSCTDDVT